jgi:Fur family ferric uptake transcriptional regulator
MAKQIRETRQRTAIMQVLSKSSHPLRPKQIRELAADKIPSLGIATVYRNLKDMVADGLVEVIDLPGGQTCYAVPRQKKKPLMVCQRSQQVKVVEGADVDLPLPEFPEDFKLHRYEVIYFGEFTDSLTDNDLKNSEPPEDSEPPEEA